MSQRPRAIDIAAAVPGPRERSGRWTYLVAMLVPAWHALNEILSPFPTYGYAPWISAGLVVVCAIQFYRPTLTLWLPVFLWYAGVSAGAIWSEIGVFQDYGSEDHSRWEGWHTEWVSLTFTAFLIWVTVQVALQIRKRARNAT